MLCSVLPLEDLMSLEFITLTCRSCGGKLEIYPETDRFACGYCGKESVVQRRGGTVNLQLLEETAVNIQRGTDKTAAELAVRRLPKEIEAARLELTQIIDDLKRKNLVVDNLIANPPKVLKDEYIASPIYMAILTFIISMFIFGIILLISIKAFELPDTITPIIFAIIVPISILIAIHNGKKQNQLNKTLHLKQFNEATLNAMTNYEKEINFARNKSKEIEKLIIAKTNKVKDLEQHLLDNQIILDSKN